MITKERIKILAQEVGFDACGVTVPKPPEKAEEAFRNWTRQGKHGEMKYLEDYGARRNQFWSHFENAKSVIVLGVNYYSNSCHSEAEGRRMTGKLTGGVARYAWGNDYHKVIPKKLEILKQKIKEEAGAPVRLESAVDTRPLFERSFAQRAGLGFIGKQTQLLSLQFGPWLFLSELITDLELESDTPFSGSCGTCRLCIDECPTDAIEETGSIDARKCIAYLTIEHKSEIPIELRPKIGNWVFGCDECLNICPYTAKQRETHLSELTAHFRRRTSSSSRTLSEKNIKFFPKSARAKARSEVLAHIIVGNKSKLPRLVLAHRRRQKARSEEAGFGTALDLAKLFEIKSNREYEKVFAESAISRATRKRLLRNACVVLGNSGAEEALPILEQAVKDQAPLVREHAQWAINQIRKRTRTQERSSPKSLIGDPYS